MVLNSISKLARENNFLYSYYKKNTTAYEPFWDGAAECNTQHTYKEKTRASHINPLPASYVNGVSEDLARFQLRRFYPVQEEYEE